jgi:hypothetical protein
MNALILKHSIEIKKKTKKKEICRLLTNVDFTRIYKKTLYMNMKLESLMKILAENNINIPDDDKELKKKNKFISTILDKLPYPDGDLSVDDLRNISKKYKLPYSETLSMHDQTEQYKDYNVLKDIYFERDIEGDECEWSLDLRQYLAEIDSDIYIPHYFEFVNVMKNDGFSTCGLFVQNGSVNENPSIFDIDKYFQELDNVVIPSECEIEFFNSIDGIDSIQYGSEKGKITKRNNETITVRFQKKNLIYPIKQIKAGTFTNASFYLYPSNSTQFRYNKKILFASNVTFHSKLYSTEFIHNFVSMNIHEYIFSMKPNIPSNFNDINKFLANFETSIFKLHRSDFSILVKRMNKKRTATHQMNKVYADNIPKRKKISYLSHDEPRKVIQMLVNEEQIPINENFIDNHIIDFDKKYDNVIDMLKEQSTIIKKYLKDSNKHDNRREFITYDDLIKYKMDMQPNFESVATKMYNSRLFRMKSLKTNKDIIISEFKSTHNKVKLFEMLVHDRQTVCNEMKYILHRSTLCGEVSPFQEEVTTESIGQHAPLHQETNAEAVTDVHLYFKLLKLKPNSNIIRHINEVTPKIRDTFLKLKSHVKSKDGTTQKLKAAEPDEIKKINMYVCVGFVCILVYLRLCNVSNKDTTFHGNQSWMWDLNSVIQHFSDILKRVYKSNGQNKHQTTITFMIKLIRANDNVLASLIDDQSNQPPYVDKSNLNTIRFKPMNNQEFKTILNESKRRDIYDKSTLIEYEPMLKYSKSIHLKKTSKIHSTNIIEHSKLPNLDIQTRNNVDNHRTKNVIDLDLNVKTFFSTKNDAQFKKEYEDVFIRFEKDFVRKPHSKVMSHLISPNIVIKKAVADQIISVEESVRLLEESHKNDHNKLMTLMQNIYNIYLSYTFDGKPNISENHRKFKEVVKKSFDDIIHKYEEHSNISYDVLLKNKRILQENEREKKINMISNLSDDNVQIIRELETRGIKDIPIAQSNTEEIEYVVVQSTDDE